MLVKRAYFVFEILVNHSFPGLKFNEITELSGSPII